jgi:signal transduction histidine kinase
LGLYGMRERARLLGGSLWLRSAPGRGCAVRATIPVRWSYEPASVPVDETHDREATHVS